jgi:hypothetical protein
MSSEYLLNQAIKAINSGNKQSGQWLLTELLNDDPYNEEGWLWMALVVESEEERLQCLEQVLAINPYNEDARREMAMLRPNEVVWYRKAPGPVTPEPESHPEPAVTGQPCPHCGEVVDPDDQFCRFCGGPLQEDVTPSNSESPDRPRASRKKPWYFSAPILLFTFVFLTPLWSILVLSDEQQSGVAKIFAVIILLIYILLLFFASLYYGALTAT